MADFIVKHNRSTFNNMLLLVVIAFLFGVAIGGFLSWLLFVYIV